MSELTVQLQATLVELGVPDENYPAPVANAVGHIERALEIAPLLEETERLLGYLWTATGKNHLRPVSDLFDESDPIIQDVERLAIFPETTPA